MRALRQQMQMVFQDPYSCIDPRYTVAQAISEPLQIHGLSKDYRSRIKKWRSY